MVRPLAPFPAGWESFLPHEKWIAAHTDLVERVFASAWRRIYEELGVDAANKLSIVDTRFLSSQIGE